MSSISNGLTTFSENDKFDGTNWIAFKTIVAEVWEAIGYLDSNIIDPSTVVKPSSKPEMTTSTSILPL